MPAKRLARIPSDFAPAASAAALLVAVVGGEQEHLPLPLLLPEVHRLQGLCCPTSYTGWLEPFSEAGLRQGALTACIAAAVAVVAAGHHEPVRPPCRLTAGSLLAAVVAECADAAAAAAAEA